MSKPYKKILILENEMEAQRLSSILEEEGIPHMVRSYHDSVYDGIFQSQRGWGHLEAPEEYEDTINLLYNNMRGE
jgi:outer membrane protein assembly factor BamE (lipoprotein component of BamABCDE complex)